MDTARQSRSKSAVAKAMALDRHRRNGTASPTETAWRFAQLPPPPVRDALSDLGVKRWGVGGPIRLPYLQPSAERIGTDGWGRQRPLRVFRVLQPQTIRLGFAADSDERTVVADVAIGEQVTALEQRGDGAGSASVRTDRGWLCHRAAGGQLLLQEVGAPAAGSRGESDEWGRTALIWAAIRGQDAEVKRLLAAGVDLDARDVDGWTALM